MQMYFTLHYITTHLDAANTQLYVKANITLADGAGLANDAQVGPIHLFLHSLFSDVKVSLNETPVTLSNNTYAYRAYTLKLYSAMELRPNSHN